MDIVKKTLLIFYFLLIPFIMPSGKQVMAQENHQCDTPCASCRGFCLKDSFCNETCTAVETGFGGHCAGPFYHRTCRCYKGCPEVRCDTPCAKCRGFCFRDVACNKACEERYGGHCDGPYWDRKCKCYKKCPSADTSAWPPSAPDRSLY